MLPKYKKLIVSLAIISCLSGLLFATFFYFKKPVITVPTVKVTRGSISEQAEAIGYIKSRNFSMVKSPVSGIVEVIYHAEGDYVEKDTPLVKIRPTPTPVEYAEAHKNLIADIAEEKDASTNLQRFKRLLKSGIIIKNDHRYITARKNYNAAKTQRILSEQKLALLTQGETMVGDKPIASTIRSPLAGHILYCSVNVGDPVISISSAQAATPLSTIANMQDMTFQGFVDESDVAKLKAGMSAEINIGSLPEEKITGTISRIALQSDKENADTKAKTGTKSNSPFNVAFGIEIANLKFASNLLLRSGYSATASVTIKKAEDILILPLRLIHFKDSKPYILLPPVDNQSPKERYIELGISDSVNVEIKKGLKFDEEVLDQVDSTVINQNK